MKFSPIFLVSTGRTGTLFFSKLFKSYAVGVKAFHTSNNTHTLNILNNLAVCHLLPQTFADQWFIKIKYPEISSESNRWIECNPYYFNSIRIIWHLFPTARIIFITRHPQEFCLSHLRWERQRIASQIANQLVPYWSPVGYHHQIFGLLNITKQRIDYYARVWNKRNEVIIKSIANDPRAKLYRFEDIFNPENGLNIITNLFNWLELNISQPLQPELLNKRVNQTKKTDICWNQDFNKIIQKHCEDLMIKFGYFLK